MDWLSREDDAIQPGEEPLPPPRWYVSPEDAAQCFRAALEAGVSDYRVFNVAARDSFSSRPSLAVAEAAYGTLPKIRSPERFDTAPRASLLVCTRAREELGWSPRDDRSSLVSANAG